MKEGYPTNQNLETNQLEPQEIHPLEDSYINHDILSSIIIQSLQSTATIIQSLVSLHVTTICCYSLLAASHNSSYTATRFTP